MDQIGRRVSLSSVDNIVFILFQFVLEKDHHFIFPKAGVSISRPYVMDHAVLRLGRFRKLLYLPLSRPSPDECWLILKALARKKPGDGSFICVQCHCTNKGLCECKWS